MYPQFDEVRLTVEVMLTVDEYDEITSGQSDYRTKVVDAINRGAFEVIDTL